jgi:rare lipoprotein A
MMRFQTAIPAIPAFLLVACCLLLGACGTSQKRSTTGSYQIKDGTAQGGGGGFKVGKPYQINGVWYYPNEDYSYDETGIASWYGPDFHGKFTANGEIFNQNDVTAAHRTLPMPSIVRVTNLENGRSILVRVNDRGPFAHGRILDLSKHAAELLALDLQGTARVRVQVMADESRMLALQLKAGDTQPLEAAPRVAVQAEALPPPSGRAAAPARTGKTAKPAPSASNVAPMETAAVDIQSLDQQPVEQLPPRNTRLFIQAGAFSRFDNANKMSAALAAVGPAGISQIQTKSGSFFRVRIGPLASLPEADSMLEKVIASGYPGARLVVD